MSTSQRSLSRQGRRYRNIGGTGNRHQVVGVDADSAPTAAAAAAVVCGDKLSAFSQHTYLIQFSPGVMIGINPRFSSPSQILTDLQGRSNDVYASQVISNYYASKL